MVTPYCLCYTDNQDEAFKNAWRGQVHKGLYNN